MVADGNAIDPAGGQHILRHMVPADRRDDEAGIVLDILGHLGNRRRLEPQVQLQPGRAIEGLDDLGRSQPARRAYQPLGEPRRGVEALDIGAEPRLDARPQHLDRNRARQAACRPQARLVHLGDRCRRHRRRKLGQFARLAAQRRGENPGHQSRVEWLHLVLKPRQVVGDLCPHHVGARRQRLPELDIGGPEPVERLVEAFDMARPAHARPLHQPPQPDAQAQRGQRRRQFPRDRQRPLAGQHIAGPDQAEIGGEGHRAKSSTRRTAWRYCPSCWCV